MTKEDEEVQTPESSKMTKSIFIIIGNISMERFCTAGVLTILPLFLHQRLFLDHNTATVIFHTFECMMLFFTVFGAVISETWLGLYRSVILMTFVYIIGLGCVSTSMIEQFNLPIDIFVSIGLIIMLIGSGSLKNSLTAFGGSQHKLPEQKVQLEKYFSVQYLGVKTGSFLARIFFPMLRADVKCFGKDDCYSLTFGIPMIIMILSLTIFLLGRKDYIKLPPNGNMLVKVIKCVKYALLNKPKDLPESERKQHWLENSEEKYGKKLVMETKIALKVVLMSLPVPIFWACLMQQRSRWIFQAVRMNGDIGWYTIKPDQMIVFNSLLSITFIPILDKFIYPIFEKIGIKTMLQRLIFGGILIVIAFVLSAIVETQIQYNYISILWQLPQFIVISIAEIFTYLSHLNFAYKEAPPSMKPVMMSLLYLSMAGGDLIIAILSTVSFFPSQTYEYAFYACLMLVDVVVLSFLARSYSRDEEENKTITNNANDGKF